MELEDISPDYVEQAKHSMFKALNPRMGEKVTIAYPHLDTCGTNFVESVLRNVAYDKARGNNYLMNSSGLMNNGALAAVWGRSVELSHARNVAAQAFMSSDSDWLLWWDTDIGAQENAVEALMAVADPVERPIVGGLCFVETDFSHDFHGGLKSGLNATLYDWCWVEPANGMPGMYKMLPRAEWPTNDVVRVAATGTGLLLVHRSAFQKISEWTVDQGAPASIWYERIMGPDGERCGEDISFCMRAHQVGLPVYVHTGVTTTHQKSVWYGPAEYKQKPAAPPAANLIPLPPAQWPLLQVNPDAAKDAAAQSPVRVKQAPESDEHVAIIVPVAKRDNAHRFLSSLEDTLTPQQQRNVRVYAMTDETDVGTWDAWYNAANTTPVKVSVHSNAYKRDMGTFAEKVNGGFLESHEPWIFIVGDDVHFRQGWLDQAMQVARTHPFAQVIGTNDLGTRAVQNGEHATHMFINRDYVEQVGAGWDGPGVVAHEGYRHWFVDNEIVEAAKQRGVWMPCLTSVVEHLHPYFQKADMDDVYKIGEANAEADRALYTVRWGASRQEDTAS